MSNLWLNFTRFGTKLQLQRFDLPSADLEHATLAAQLKWHFKVVIVGNDQVASHRRVAAHSRFYSLLHCQLYCYIHNLQSHT